MSDGCLLKEGRNKTAYAVRICSNDREIIAWMHNYMCRGNKIYMQHNGYLIKYRNLAGIQFMRNNKLIERKSLCVEYPDSIPSEQTRHFIRGYFDGNGSIVINERSYNVYGQVRIACGSEHFLNRMKEVLAANQIKAQIYRDGRPNNASYYLTITSRRNVERFFSYMYDDVPAQEMLQRKYLKYSEYLNNSKLKYNITHIA